MKTFIALVLAIAGAIHFIAASKADVQDYMCASYLSTNNPTVYWPTCDSADKAADKPLN